MEWWEWITWGIAAIAGVYSAVRWIIQDARSAPHLMWVLRPPRPGVGISVDESWSLVLRNSGGSDVFGIVTVITSARDGRVIEWAFLAEHVPAGGEAVMPIGEQRSPEFLIERLMEAGNTKDGLGAVGYRTPRGKRKSQKAVRVMIGDGYVSS